MTQKMVALLQCYNASFVSLHIISLNPIVCSQDLKIWVAWTIEEAGEKIPAKKPS